MNVSISTARWRTTTNRQRVSVAFLKHTPVDHPSPASTYVVALNELVDALEGRGELRSDGRVGLRSLEMVMAIYQSQLAGTGPSISRSGRAARAWRPCGMRDSLSIGNECHSAEKRIAMAESEVRGSWIEYDVIVRRNVMVPMRDGVNLATDLYFPAKHGDTVPGRVSRSDRAHAVR